MTNPSFSALPLHAASPHIATAFDPSSSCANTFKADDGRDARLICERSRIE